MSKVIIIGGGWFGLYLAHYLGSKHQRVELFEKSSALMTRASYNNQARIHNGYHYPRSVLTALRSRQSFPRFIKDFPKCVCDDFDKYYMIGKHLSKVTAYQFEKFCKRIGAYLEPAPSEIVNLTHKNYIEACFKAKEFAFDSVKLKEEILSRIDEKYVTIHLNSQVLSVSESADKTVLKASVQNLITDEIEEYQADGNKRIGAHAMIMFLYLNGVDLSFTQKELIDLFLSLAAGNTDANELHRWLQAHVV